MLYSGYEELGCGLCELLNHNCGLQILNDGVETVTVNFVLTALGGTHHGIYNY